MISDIVVCASSIPYVDKGCVGIVTNVNYIDDAELDWMDVIEVTWFSASKKRWTSQHYRRLSKHIILRQPRTDQASIAVELALADAADCQMIVNVLKDQVTMWEMPKQEIADYRKARGVLAGLFPDGATSEELIRELRGDIDFSTRERLKDDE